MKPNILDIFYISRIKPLGFMALFVLSISNVNAVPITFQFEGELASVDNPLSGTFSPGDTFSGSYTFDSAAPVTASCCSGAFEKFDNAVSSMSVVSNGYLASASSGNIIQDFEDDKYYTVNLNSVSGPLIGNLALTSMRISWVRTSGVNSFPDIDAGGPVERPRFDPDLPPWFVDSNAAPFYDADGNLVFDFVNGLVGDPNQPLFTDTNGQQPAATNDNNLILSFSDGMQTVRVIGDFSSVTVVPIPATVWLFGTGLMGLIGFAKRKQICN